MRPIDSFDTAVELYGSRRAIVDREAALSYAELAVLTHGIASIVHSINHGEALPIAICSPNDYRAVAATLGIMRAGGAVMPLHLRSGPQGTADYLKQLRPRAVLYHSEASALIRSVRRHVDYPTRWICLDGGPDGDVSMDTLLKETNGYVDRWADPFANPNRPVFIRQTSGSTGTPKIVAGDITSFALSHLAVRHYLAAGIDVRRQQPVCLVAAPFSHAAGLHAFAMLTLGATLVLMREFDALDVLRCMARYRVSHMWLPASALNLILACPNVTEFDCSSLKQILIGASAVSPVKLTEAVAALGPCLAVHYGQIESGFLTWLNEREVAEAVCGKNTERLASSGQTMHVGRVSIMDDEGRQVPSPQTGEIVVRSLTVKPYISSLGQHDTSEMAATKTNGWHRTGDIGYIDAQGYLYVVGRKKDMVITGGFKVPAAQVEGVIMELSVISECAVVAVPDRLRGEMVKAIVVARDGAAIDVAAILRHCRSRLGALNSPASIDCWSELPRTAVGKIDKRQIRERLDATSA